MHKSLIQKGQQFNLCNLDEKVLFKISFCVIFIFDKKILLSKIV